MRDQLNLVRAMDFQSIGYRFEFDIPLNGFNLSDMAYSFKDDPDGQGTVFEIYDANLNNILIIG